MGAKKVYPLNQLITNGIMAGVTTLLSEIIPIGNGDNFGIEVEWSGSPVGVISILCSNSGINFDALTFNPPLSQPAGVPGGYLINLNQLPFQYLQFSYTNVSGAGVLNVWSFGKDLN
jgi:hypothetical protein